MPTQKFNLGPLDPNILCINCDNLCQVHILTAQKVLNQITKQKIEIEWIEATHKSMDL